ncbi:MAG: Gfo/Idh/MocA family oxidoreductase [Bryobacterales bacterium]
MTRRTFVAATAAAAAAQKVSAQDQVHVGVIGVGGRGRSLTGLLTGLPEARVGWICDADQASLERAQKVISDAGAAQPQTTNDMRRVFDDPSIDAVVIATPDHWHAPATILACDAGKDVYVEKPCSHNIREGRLMIDAARRNERIVQMGVQRRSMPTFQQAMQDIRDGKLGSVHAAKAWDVQMRDDIGHAPDQPVPDGVDYETWLGAAPWIPFNPNRFHYKWHWHWHFGTGDAGNDGVHHMDLARWALGVSYPSVVGGHAKKYYFDDDQQTPDTMNIAFDHGDKSLIWEMRIWNPYGIENGVENGIAVYGDQGAMIFGRWGRNEAVKVLDSAGKEVETREVGRQEGSLHMQNFLDCVKSRKLPNCDIGEGHLSTLRAPGEHQARVNRTVRFDAETESVIDDEQANLYVSRKYRTHWSTPQVI